MMPSSDGTISHITDPLWGESTGQTIETPVIWDAIGLIMTLF